MRHKGKLVIGILVVVYIISISVYHSGNRRITGETALSGETGTIVTSFYPMYMHVQQLTKGTDRNIVNLTEKQVGCLHDYQLTVNDMQKISAADIIVINGLGNENFMDKAYEQNKDLKVINASSQIEENLEKEHHDEEEDLEHEKHEEHEHSHHGHNHAFNEHIWVSVEGSINQVKAISKGLQALDPSHAQIYKENEEMYVKELNVLKNEMHQVLKGIKGKSIVTTHSTFEYFAKEFGLETACTILQDEESIPTPRQIEEMVNKMKQKDIHIIFTEKQYEYLGIVKTIARETDSKIYYLDSFVTEEADGSYISRMKNNLEVLKEAYGL